MLRCDEARLWRRYVEPSSFCTVNAKASLALKDSAGSLNTLVQDYILPDCVLTRFP